MTYSFTRQLIGLAALSVSAALIIMLGCPHIPRMFGIGQTNLTAYLPDAATAYLVDGAGLHPDSTVTDRGVVIGTITAVNLTPQGITVDLSVDDSVKIGADATATIEHTSPIGEVSLELVSDQPGGPYLSDGALIPPAPITTPEPNPPMLEHTTD